jgi:NTE family protein
MSKHALVINGGISRGAFAVGVIKKIFEIRPDLNFDILVGTGTGSLIVPFVALKELDPLVEIFTTKQNKEFIRPFSLSERLEEPSILDASPFWGLLDRYYTHHLYNRLLETSRELYFNTVCLQTHELTVFSNQPNPAVANRYAYRTIENYDQFLRTLLASSCQPVLLPPITIQPGEIPIRQYIDGGDREYAGIEIAIASGATDIYTILLSPPSVPAENKEYKDIYSILQKTLDIFIGEEAGNDRIPARLYNEGLRYIDDVKKKMRNSGIPEPLIDEWFNAGHPENPYQNKKPVRLHIIRPDQPLGGGPDSLHFDPPAMQTMLTRGEQKTREYFAAGGIDE